MKNPIDGFHEATGERLRNPPLQLESATRHELWQDLTWTWGLVAILSLVATFGFGFAWLAPLLIAAGAVISVSLLQRAKRRRRRMQPVPMLSRASKCVWQMDREA